MSYKDDEELLEAVKSWRPPEKLHPLAMQAWDLYEAAGNRLPEDGIQTIRDVLDSHGDDLVGLAEALEGLTRFLIHASEELEDEETSEKVMSLMREYTHRFEPFWQRVGEAIQNVSARRRGSLLDFMDVDQSADRVAPTFGVKAPDHSVPLSSLVPPSRPRPVQRPARARRKAAHVNLG